MAKNWIDLNDKNWLKSCQKIVASCSYAMFSYKAFPKTTTYAFTHSFRKAAFP